MAFNVESPTFKIPFKDGTFITVVNELDPNIYAAGVDYTFALPNFGFIGQGEQNTTVTKEDLAGNKWIFYYDGVKIGSNSKMEINYSTYTYGYLGYNPNSKTLYMSMFGIPPARTESTYVTAYAVNSVVGGVASIGEWIAKGQKKWKEAPAVNWYSVMNFVDVQNTPMKNTTVFGVHQGSNIHLDNYFITQVGAYNNINIDLNDIIEDLDPNIGSDDPYNQVPGSSPTDEGGGHGNGDEPSDNVDFPTLPTISASDTGFVTLFNPTTAQLKGLASYMWSNAFDVATFKKLFANPMDAILGLSIVPVNVPSSGARAVCVGNISTGVSLNVASQQYVEVDCGSIKVSEKWGAYIDYAPYTQVQIYLPFIGTHALDTDDVMGKTIHVKYHVDILSGSLNAYVKCGSSVLYQFIGQCSSSIPINGNDWTNVINGALNIASAIGSMVATGGATAPMALGTVASTAVNDLKPAVEKSGSMSGTGGLLAIKYPYIILTRPRQAIPSNQNKYMGYPSFVTKNLGDISGYNVIDSIRLSNIRATKAEQLEIETLLKEGVIL